MWGRECFLLIVYKLKRREVCKVQSPGIYLALNIFALVLMIPDSLVEIKGELIFKEIETIII